MFGELIEKLKDKMTPDLGSDHFDFTVAINIIEEYQKEQEKAFDSSLIKGFERDFRYSYKVFTLADKDHVHIMLMKDGLYRITGIEIPIKVPSHAFGVELLKNLGVIE